VNNALNEPSGVWAEDLRLNRRFIEDITMPASQRLAQLFRY